MTIDQRCQVGKHENLWSVEGKLGERVVSSAKDRTDRRDRADIYKILNKAYLIVNETFPSNKYLLHFQDQK